MSEEPVVAFEFVSAVIDDEERDEAARQLVSQFREAGIEARVVAGGGSVPEGAKSGVPVELVSAIAVGLATTGLEEVVRYAWSWLRHRKHPEHLKMSLSSGSFELTSDMSSDQLEGLLRAISAAQGAAGAPAT